MSIKTWGDLKFFGSGEEQVINERLSDYDFLKVRYNPRKSDMYAGLNATPYDKARVAIIGQDPYPNSGHATGVAFSIPGDYPHAYPPTLNNIFKEYQDDLHYTRPSNGSLLPWTRQGVLLWNAYPSCLAGVPGSHHWPEWEGLTEEIIKELDEKNIVFAFLGGSAGLLAKHVVKSACIQTSHPSPRGAHLGKSPFIGSRLFTTINAKLVDKGLEAIDWRLNELPIKKRVQGMGTVPT